MAQRGGRLKTFFIYTKPRIWFLLAFVAAISSLIAIRIYSLKVDELLIATIVSVSAGGAGAESLTNYIDRHMDAVMERTKNRPLIVGAITPKQAITMGAILISLSILIPLMLGKFLSSVFMAAGIFDNVFVYNYLLKKRTPLNIILGGFSGGFPVLVGWYMITSINSVIPWFLFSLVVVWIPLHIWSLAYRYREDYKRARVPMLPVVYSNRVAVACIVGSAIVLVAFSLIPAFFIESGIIYGSIVLILSIPILILSFRFSKEKSLNSSFSLFKYSSPYLAFVFITFIITKIFFWP